MPGKLILKRFGKYLLLDHLVDGGMAKICRARFLSEDADKIVAIKMIQQQFCNDESFKKMFIDEIKVTFGLIHPNIAQTYDYGVKNGQLFTAMEYVDGRNLKEYLDKLKKRKVVFPVEISVYIMAQVCQGLHYAHDLKNKLTGEKMEIIHRDISPHNIMLTFDGSVKIIDFGIAKAQSNSDKTQAGTIKGKLSYLAPEYLEGDDLDPRYDQFAIGITLWEMLCSRKLFKAKNDLAVLKKIQACKVPPPSTINPNVPKELDLIILKALSKDREKRYKNLDQLNRALIKFLYSRYTDFNATDLAYFAGDLFKEEIESDQQAFFEFGKVDMTPFLARMKEENEGHDKRDAKVNGEEVEEDSGLYDKQGVRRQTVIDLGFENEETALKNSAGNKVIEGTGSTILTLDANPNKILNKNANSGSRTGVKNVARKKKVASAAKGKGPSGSKTNVTFKTPGQRKRRRDQASSSSNSKVAMIATLLMVGGIFLFYDSVAEYVPFLSSKKVKEIKKEENPERKPASIKKGKIIISDYDESHRVYLNNSKASVSFLGEIEVLYSENPYTLRIEESQKKHFILKNIMMNDSNKRMVIEIPDREYVEYAFLTGGENCMKRGAIEFEIYGEKRSSTIPLNEQIAFPLGVHKITIRGKVTSSKYLVKPQAIEVKFDKADNAIDVCDTLRY